MENDNQILEDFYVAHGGKPTLSPDIWFYESDWGMLMGIVEKIETLGFEVVIHSDAAFIKKSYFSGNVPNIENVSTKFGATRKTCVEFINWYTAWKQTHQK